MDRSTSPAAFQVLEAAQRLAGRRRLSHTGHLSSQLGYVRGEANFTRGCQDQDVAYPGQCTELADDVAQTFDVALEHCIFPGHLQHAIQLQRGFSALIFELLAVQTEKHHTQQQRRTAGGQQHAAQQAVAQLGNASGHGARILQANAIRLDATELSRLPASTGAGLTSSGRHAPGRNATGTATASASRREPQAGRDFFPARPGLAEMICNQVA
jgi:hypothetical protein